MTRFLFISYLNRSGSTFLINQLSRIPDFCVCPEADILYKLFLRKPFQVPNNLQLIRYFEVLQNDRKFVDWKLQLLELQTENVSGKNGASLFFEILLHFRNTHFPNATSIVFKNNYLLDLPLFAENHIYQLALARDPRAIYFSQKTTLAPPSQRPMCSNPFLFVLSYKHFCDQIEANREKNNFVKIDYEELIERLEPTMDEILQWMGIRLKFAEYKNSPPLHSKWLTDEYRNIHRLIDQQPETNSLYKWKNNLSVPEQLIIQKYCSTGIKNQTIQLAEWKLKLLSPFLLLIYLPDMLFKTCIDQARKVKFIILLRWKK